MDIFGNWLIGITAAAMIYSAVLSLAPEGQARRAVKIVGGACMLLALFMPLGSIDIDDFSLSAFAASDDYKETVKQLEKTNYDIQKSIIEQRLSAYIAQKANALGLSVTAEVHTEEIDGIPMPVSVTGEYDGDASSLEQLSRALTEELGIPLAAQHFEERVP